MKQVKTETHTKTKLSPTSKINKSNQSNVNVGKIIAKSKHLKNKELKRASEGVLSSSQKNIDTNQENNNILINATNIEDDYEINNNVVKKDEVF